MILSGTENTFGLESVSLSISFILWLTPLSGGSSVIFFSGKTSRNSLVKSGILVKMVIPEYLKGFAFLHSSVMLLSGNVMISFPQSIMALCSVRYGIPRKMS